MLAMMPLYHSFLPSHFDEVTFCHCFGFVHACAFKISASSHYTRGLVYDELNLTMV